MNLSARAPRRLAPALLHSLAWSLALGGCLTGKSTIGLLDGNDDTDATATAGSSSGGDESTGLATTANPDGGPSDGSEPSTGGEPPHACPAESGCSFALTCGQDGIECGGILGRANDDGCPRPICSQPGECPDGSSCFIPESWAMCGPHGCYDNEDTGACECGFGLDCNSYGLCVPDEEGVPPDTNGTEFCGQHTDSASCEGSLPAELGACRWYEGWQMPLGAACEERTAVGRCTFTADFVDPGPTPSCPGNESLTPRAFIDAGVVTVLFIDPEQPPIALEIDVDADSWGWFTCDSPDAAAECACACG